MESSVRRLACIGACAIFVSVTVSGVPARAGEPAQPAGAWQRPVDGAVVRPFQQPSSIYGPGHRGVDFAAAPGTPVHAANDGVVSFAGSVAGTLHVTVAHDGNLRTSYSFLQTIGVREGQAAARGDVVGTTGGAGSDHDASVLHFGLRTGETYVDPMVLFRPDDLTKLVRLVPAGDPHEAPWTSADERRELQASLHLPSPGQPVAGSSAADEADGDGCGPDVPVVGAVVDAACDVGDWLGDRAGVAVDAGLRALHAAAGTASDVLDGLRGPLHDTIAMLRALPATVASGLARTPIGMLALDIVEIGRRFADTVTTDCTDYAAPADGTGGSAHRVMVLAGINSSGQAGDRGPTVALDVAALGYHRGEGEVRFYSYAQDGGPYDAGATRGSLLTAARRLADQLRAMQREQPGREVDLIAHSQGGVVVDVFLHKVYRAADPTLPPIGTVITLSSPHEGAPLATAGSQVRSSSAGKWVLDEVGHRFGSLPPPNAVSVRQLSEHSSLIRGVQRGGVPEHVDYTSIGATEDLVVPATNISLRGATETTVAVNSPGEHSAIVQDPNALRAVRAALEGRAPPCVGLGTALRGAIAPVLISRASHGFGDVAGAALGGGTR
ncbi:MAG: peptidoglycan DD-metalloendopeptidase family protein [Acidimicrobiia bacterium]